MDDPLARFRALLAEARESHDALLAALGRIEPELRDAPGLVGVWNAPQLLAHVAHWTENAVGALEAATAGHADSFGDEDLDVDAINADVASAAERAGFAAMQAREEASFGALLTALGEAERHAPVMALDERVRYGDSIEAVIRDDTIDHFLEHAADVRAWFGEADEEDGAE